MTARELIVSLQRLGEKNLDRKIILLDGDNYSLLNKVKLLDSSWGRLEGKIALD